MNEKNDDNKAAASDISAKIATLTIYVFFFVVATPLVAVTIKISMWIITGNW